MPLIKRGSDKLTLQASWEVDEDDSGLLTSECVFIGDAKYEALVAKVGSMHPKDPRLFCNGRKIKHPGTEVISATLSYIGIVSDPTPPKVEFPGSTGQDDIRTHPNFEDFAGTPGAPKNGAIFDDQSGEFLGFADGDFRGTQSYIVPSYTVNLSYYTHYTPLLGSIGRIRGLNVPGFIKPPNVRNFLLIGMPYRQISNLFFVTEQYLGSGKNGWNSKIY